jgi:hypothetical protein
MRMQLKRLRRLCSIGLLISTALTWMPSVVFADETTGTWTGMVDARLNYFWERSTRVVVPTIKAKASSPGGFHAGAGYLVDVITSASIAQTGSDEDQLFTELRHGVSAELGQAFDLNSSQLELGLSGVYSTEDDYTSYVYGIDAGLTLNDKATLVSLALNRVQDEILSNADPTFEGSLDGTTVGATIDQVINPVTTLTVGYQLGHLAGFLGNPYRRALQDGMAPVREAHPQTRWRHSAFGRVAWFVPSTSTAFHLLLSAYTDSWDVRALAPELRISQQLWRDLFLRPRYRFYQQTKAWFQIDGSYPATWTGPRTNDPKMTAFTTHTLGLSLEYRASFLADTIFDFAKGSTIDIKLERYWSSNRFGDGIIATAGGTLSF